jgi:hypothetical protein
LNLLHLETIHILLQMGNVFVATFSNGTPVLVEEILAQVLKFAPIF